MVELVRKKRDAASTREALLGAAGELFAEFGFEGTTIDRISRRAGVNKALISYHFQGKRKLYQALIADSFDQLGKGLDAIPGTDSPPEVRLDAFSSAFQEFVQRRPTFPRLMLREALSGGRNLDERVFQCFLRVFELLQGIIDQGTALGRFRPVNPLCTQLNLVGSLLFFYSTTKFRSRVLRTLQRPSDAIGEDEYLRYWKESILRSLATEIPSEGPPYGGVSRNEPETRSS